MNEIMIEMMRSYVKNEESRTSLKNFLIFEFVRIRERAGVNSCARISTHCGFLSWVNPDGSFIRKMTNNEVEEERMRIQLLLIVEEAAATRAHTDLIEIRENLVRRQFEERMLRGGNL